MRPTPLVVSLAAVIVAACSDVPAPGLAMPRPASTTLSGYMSGGPPNVPQLGTADLLPEVGKSIILIVGGNQVAKSRVPKTRSESPDTERSGAPEVSIKPQVIKVGPKGVITIPDENRRAMDLEPGKYVTAIQVGRSLVLSPEINEFLAIAEQFQHKLAASGTTTQALLDGLASARQDLTEELYGSPRKARRGA